ncbi:MAG: hypothetical protein AAF471_01745, partial [Myxococcota bacterium]
MEAISLTPSIISVSGAPTFSGGGSDSVTVTGLVINAETDANGTGTIRVVATDNLGGEGVVDVDVTVNAVNDPPRIVVLGGFQFNGIGVDPTFTIPSCSESSCAGQSYPSEVGQSGGLFVLRRWVVATSPGPANETEPAPVPIISDISGANLFSGGGQPQFVDNKDGTYDLVYSIGSGVSGTALVTIELDDGQAVNNTATLEFSISVNNSPPTVTVEGAPDNILEDIADQTLTGFTVAATDLEGDPVTVDVTAIGANADIIDAISVVDTDPANVLITVTPASNAFGTVDLSVVANDGAESDPVTFMLTVDNVNDRPVVVFANAATIISDNNVIDFQGGADPGISLDRNITVSSAILPFLVIEGDEAL